MATFYIYLISTIALIYFSYRLYASFKKTGNAYTKYFFYAILSTSSTEVAGLILLIIYLTTKQAWTLFALDVLARFAFNLTSVFLIQIPLYFFFPKSKKRIYASFAYLAVTIIFLIYNLSLNYQPFMDAEGIMHWQSPQVIIISSAILFLGGWLSASAVFFYQYVLSRFKSLRSLFLGLGFLFLAIGMVMQDFVRTDLAFNLLYLSILLGVISSALGFIIKE